MKTTPILFRDDDINFLTDAFRFKELHERFIRKRQMHTVAVIMKDLWENHALFYYLATAPYLEIGLHGWEHKDYSQCDDVECYEDLSKSLEYWQENASRMTGKPAKKIKTFFAPWNRSGKDIKRTCEDLGLKFCDVRKGKWNGYNVKSFHWWNCIIDNWKPF